MPALQSYYQYNNANNIPYKEMRVIYGHVTVAMRHTLPFTTKY